MDLKKCNEEIFGNVGKRKKDLVGGIQELDIIAKGRTLIAEERVRKTGGIFLGVGEFDSLWRSELKAEI